MATGPRYAVKFRRRREGKTDYRKRLALLKSGKTRLVVRPTAKRIIAQFIDYDEKGDKVVAAAQSSELKALGWKGSGSNTTAAYLTGYLAAIKAKGRIKEAILDIGLRSPSRGSLVFAAMKGAKDAGIHIPASEEVLPSDDRIRGKHLKNDQSAHFDTMLKAVIAFKPGPKKDRSKFRAKAAATQAHKPAATHAAHVPHAAPPPAPKPADEERAKRRSALEELLERRRKEEAKK